MRNLSLTLIIVWVHLAVFAAGSAWAEARPSIALHGSPALGGDFSHFSYVNPNAPKGGRVTLGVLGSFDSLNPLIIKGVPVAGVREFAIESLMARGLDEPFTLYGLLAETIDVAADGKSVTFALSPKAVFSDGKAVTADDVVFSFEVLKTKGRPNHRTYFSKVLKAEIISKREIRFTFQDAADCELPLILGLMPVLAHHALDAEKFDTTTITPLTGSGPYTVKTVDPGRSITYARNPDYWGRDLAVNRGRFNFDEIRFDYYREGSVMMDAFRRGAIDLRLEEDPGQWAEGYDFPAAKDGRVLKREFDIGYPAGMNALVFNTRRDVFKNPLVRRALITLFDAEWINRALFNGLYKRDESYFERSYLSSGGKPADQRERAALAPFQDDVRPEIMDGTFHFPVSDGSGQNRDSQKKALALLTQAGYAVRDGVLADKSGRRLSFEILANNSAQEALLLSYARSLEPIGIRARVRVVDSAQYQGRLSSYDYDMIQNTWPSSLSPGNEQLFRWSQASAKTQGTFNFAGVSNPAADAMIDAMLAAKTEEEFISAVRALDRVLLSGDYVVPLFFMPKQWVAHWARLKSPDKTPLFGYVLDAWWVEEPK
jgi:peptide/nickel transport system substrate-binding protein